jgi:aspartate/methionine/tyrosine aminotransferase
MAARLVSCNPVFVPTDSTYQPSIEKLSTVINSKTKAIVTISPNNPTGAVYSEDSLRAINELCQDHNLYHISDEVYEYFVYDDAKHHSPLCFDHSLDHTISLFSLSKAFALSGYRIGYMIFPNHLFKDLLKVQDTIGICAPSISQIAALTAIPLGNSYLSSFLPHLIDNRRIVKKKLNESSHVNGVWTKGSYYFFISIDTHQSSSLLAKRLIEEHGVIVLPGEMFDVKTPSFRISYGNLEEERLKKGLHRLIGGLDKIV